MQLTPHFSYYELIRSAAAKRHKIDNTPPASFVEKLRAVAVELEKVRAQFGRPVNINSGFRSVELNRIIKGALYSEHLMGTAVDFEIFGVDNRKVYEWIISEESGVVYSQCFLEYYDVDDNDPNSGWIHLAIPNPLKQAKHIGCNT